jgi:hypothetical protein
MILARRLGLVWSGLNPGAATRPAGRIQKPHQQALPIIRRSRRTGIGKNAYFSE